MRQQTKRILASILAVLMLVGLVPTAAFAADHGVVLPQNEKVDILIATPSDFVGSVDAFTAALAAALKSSCSGFSENGQPCGR